MKILKISSYVPQIDPYISMAAEQVVHGKKTMREVIDSFGFKSQTKIDNLSEAVIELRKLSSYPIQKIKDIYAKMIERKKLGGHGFSFADLQNETGIPQEELMWIVRRLFPESRMRPTQKEIENVIQLRQEGKGIAEIEKITRIEDQSLKSIFKTYIPDLKNEYKPKKFWENLYAEYLQMLNTMSRDEALNFLSTEHKFDKAYIKKRFWKLGDPSERITPKHITPEEKNNIVTDAKNGMSVNEIINKYNRSKESIVGILKQEPGLYHSMGKKPIPPDVKDFIIKKLKDGWRNKDIIKALQEQLGYNGSKLNISIIKNRAMELGLIPNYETQPHEKSTQEIKNNSVPLSPTQSPQSTEVSPIPEALDSSEPADDFSWFKKYKSIPRQEYEKRKPRLFTRDELEEIRTRKGLPSLPLKDTNKTLIESTASKINKINWYRR